METTETRGDPGFVAPPLLTVGEAAKLARVSRSYMWKLIDRGEVEAIPVGDSGGLRVPTQPFLGWLYGTSGRDESRAVTPAQLEPWVNVDWVRNEMTTPKSRASRRTVDFGSMTSDAFDEQWQATRYRGDEDLVFGHPFLGRPLDPSKLTRSFVKPALVKAGITKKLQPWHGQRHTALTMDAAVGNQNAYVQAKSGHSQFSITERYVHAAQVAFPAWSSSLKAGSSRR